MKPASGKSVWKAEGATVDRVVVDLSQQIRKCKKSHIHYVALSRVKRLEDLYILNMNEAAMALADDMNVEMLRSLHKHFKDVEFEPNVLAADAI